MVLSPYELLQKQKKIKNDFLNKKGKISNDFVNGFLSHTDLITLQIVFYIVGKQYLLDTEQIAEVKNREQIQLKVSSLCKELNINIKTLKQHSKKMLKTSIVMVDNEEMLKETVLISQYTFLHNKDTLIVDIYRDVLNKLLEVVAPYTRIDIKNIMNLKFKHSMKMILQLEMISKYDKDIAKRKIYMLEELQLLFGTNYKTWGAFKNNVLDKIKADLDRNSYISFIYNTHSELQKVGRPKVSKIIIDVIENSKI